jgi:hypothetical protein
MRKADRFNWQERPNTKLITCCSQSQCATKQIIAWGDTGCTKYSPVDGTWDGQSSTYSDKFTVWGHKHLVRFSAAVRDFSLVEKVYDDSRPSPLKRLGKRGYLGWGKTAEG